MILFFSEMIREMLMITDLFQSDILVPMGCKEILGFGLSFSHHSRAHDVGQNVVVDNINAVKN